MTANVYFGVDVGGTKIATSVGMRSAGGIEVCDKRVFSTIFNDPESNIVKIVSNLLQYEEKYGRPAAIGISCGGPLDTGEGVILSPPNLPGWDRVPIVQILKDQLHTPVYLENDANACALAEFHYGAGKGVSNMIFLTFGTGMGAGIILDGRLYRGATGCAGEVGHIRLAEDGPVGYGKRGSFEGFCSGGGLAQMGRAAIEKRPAQNAEKAWAVQASAEDVTAKGIVAAAREKDPDAMEIMEVCGAYLGRGLSVLIDILNPDMVVIGSIFERAGDLLIPSMEKTLREETLTTNLEACRIVPARLRESLGDYAALSIACERTASSNEETEEVLYG
jgi:glucokinase